MANDTNALFDLTTGASNTASGFGALQNNNASNNTANGVQALFKNTTGQSNTATGMNALYSNIGGGNNGLRY